jgi:hypothetical protein
MIPPRSHQANKTDFYFCLMRLKSILEEMLPIELTLLRFILNNRSLEKSSS